jgi:hypothetical protein
MVPHSIVVHDMRARLDAQIAQLTVLLRQLESAAGAYGPPPQLTEWSGLTRRLYDREVEVLARELALATHRVFEAIQHSVRARATVATRVG